MATVKSKVDKKVIHRLKDGKVYGMEFQARKVTAILDDNYAKALVKAHPDELELVVPKAKKIHLHAVELTDEKSYAKFFPTKENVANVILENASLAELEETLEEITKRRAEKAAMESNDEPEEQE